MSQSPRLSIIIVSYNTMELLRNCLASVFANSPPFAIEVLAVDNGSTDGSLEMAAREFPAVVLASNPKNAGYAAANNQALRSAMGDFLLLLNSDAEVLPGTLETLVRTMESKPQAGALGCRLLNGDGSLQRCLRSFPGFIVHAIEIAELYRVLPTSWLIGRLYPYNSDHRVSRWIDWLPGACLLVRRKSLEEVGMMDEDYFMYGEDMDWCYRMKERGWLTYFTADAEVVHLGGGSSATTRPALIVEQYRSLYRFYRKHYSRPALVRLQALVLALTLPKVLVLAALPSSRHREELRKAYWKVAWMGVKDRNALRK